VPVGSAYPYIITPDVITTNSKSNHSLYYYQIIIRYFARFIHF